MGDISGENGLVLCINSIMLILIFLSFLCKFVHALINNTETCAFLNDYVFETICSEPRLTHNVHKTVTGRHLLVEYIYYLFLCCWTAMVWFRHTVDTRQLNEAHFQLHMNKRFDLNLSFHLKMFCCFFCTGKTIFLKR